MKKLSKKQKLIGGIAIILVAIILAIVITTNVINNNVGSESYSATTANANSNLVAGYIKEGITIGGVTGTLESLNTFDATALPEDILWGETAYVKGEKITGTKIVTVAHAKAAQKTFEENTTLIDDYGNRVKVPAGFKIASDSATAVEDGVVIEDKDGNQFVWIPAKTGEGASINLSSGNTQRIVYQRTDFGRQYGSYSDYSYTLSSDEETSVNTWGGYFIGRYEAGDKESTESETMRDSGTSQSNMISIKKGQVPYNWITQANAKNKAEEMNEAENYKTTYTKLISGYAWDTAINFIQIKNNDYGLNSVEGNYINTKFDYIDIKGNKQTKDNNESILIPTGQTTAVSNIFDMGGNLWEYIDENISKGGPYVNRGGRFAINSEYSAGYRNYYYGESNLGVGFRVTLYLENYS